VPRGRRRRTADIEHQFAVNRGTRRPADDQTREQIHDDREVEPALPRADVGDIGDPGGVWPRGGELPLQEIRDEERWLAGRPAPNPIPMQRAQVVLAHQASDTMLTAGFPRLSQIEKDAGSAINAVTRDERCANQSKESGIFLIVVRNRSLQPQVVAADRDPEDAAHHLDAVLISMGLNEGVGRSDSSRDLVLGLRHRSSAKSRMLAPVH